MDLGEKQWKQNRCGCISASKLKDLKIGKKGGVLQATKDYISQLRFERTRNYSLHEDNRNFRMGKKYEPEAVAWLKHNYPEYDFVYSSDEKEYETPPFIKVDWAKYGASPDIVTRDRKIIVDTKILCTPSTISYFHDQTISYSEKQAVVLEEHGDQIIGLFLAIPEAEEFWIVKYNPQNEDNELDTNCITEMYRGSIFKFKRSEFGIALDNAKQTIILYDLFVDSPYHRNQIKDATLKKVNEEYELVVSE